MEQAHTLKCFGEQCRGCKWFSLCEEHWGLLDDQS